MKFLTDPLNYVKLILAKVCTGFYEGMPISAEHNHQLLPPPTGNGNGPAISNSNTTGINSIAAKSNSSRPGTPVSSFKRDSPGQYIKPSPKQNELHKLLRK